jgi:hypothetical protein
LALGESQSINWLAKGKMSREKKGEELRKNRQAVKSEQKEDKQFTKAKK